MNVSTEEELINAIDSGVNIIYIKDTIQVTHIQFISVRYRKPKKCFKTKQKVRLIL